MTTQYEIGAKLQTTGLTFTAAVFDMRKPLQFNASNVFVQYGDQRHHGVELLATGLVTRDLRLVAAAMYLDSEQRNTGNPATDGKEAPGVPQWIANLFSTTRSAPCRGCSWGRVLHRQAVFRTSVSAVDPVVGALRPRRAL